MNNILYVALREYHGEYKSRYRATVCEGVSELEICDHDHRSPEAARKCGHKMMVQISRERHMARVSDAKRVK